MSQNSQFREVFGSEDNKEFLKTLEHKILLRVKVLESRKRNQNIILSGFFVSISLAGIFGSSRALWITFKESGTYEILSLALSDYGELGLIWKEILFAFVESIPTVTIALLLSLIITFIFSSIKTLEIISPKIRRA